MSRKGVRKRAERRVRQSRLCLFWLWCDEVVYRAGMVCGYYCSWLVAPDAAAIVRRDEEVRGAAGIVVRRGVV